MTDIYLFQKVCMIEEKLNNLIERVNCLEKTLKTTDISQIHPHKNKIPNHQKPKWTTFVKPLIDPFGDQ